MSGSDLLTEDDQMKARHMVWPLHFQRSWAVTVVQSRNAHTKTAQEYITLTLSSYRIQLISSWIKWKTKNCKNKK
jgi:hypothetical protein